MFGAIVIAMAILRKTCRSAISSTINLTCDSVEQSKRLTTCTLVMAWTRNIVLAYLNNKTQIKEHTSQRF